jgi:ABC-2 type transport system permease protein
MKWGKLAMKLKTSYFNKGVLHNDIKRFGWVGICYLIFLLFEVPFKIFTINASNAAHPEYIESMQNVFSNDTLKLSTAVIPVLIAILLFRYIQSKKSVDMIHCLPIKRVKIYDNHIFIGILFLVVPVLITALAALLLKGALNLNNTDIHFTVKTVTSWTGSTILFNIVIFLSSVFVGMFTGLSSAQGILTYIFLFLPMGLTTLINYNINFFVYGVANDYYINNGIAFFSPIQRYISISPMTSMEMFRYIMFCIILYLAARFAYHKRSLEAASNAVAFKNLQPVFKYGITFCCMLLGGIYFRGPGYGFSWVIFGYTIASLVGYIIAEIIMTKSLRIFRNIRGYFIYAIIIVFVAIVINSDIIGYEKRMPALENIENIYLENSFYYSNGKLDNQIRVYSEKENLNNIEKLHKKLIEDKKSLKHSSSSNEQVAILYTLKNGKQIKRQYNIPPQGYGEYLKPIYESKEYKKMHNNILNNDYSSIDKISINSSKNKNTIITNPIEIKEAIEILKNEVLNETYEDIIDSRDVWTDINILLSDDKRIDLSWKRSYKEFENWLKQKGYYAKARLMPEDIDYALIEKRDPNNPHGGINQSQENSNIKRLKITDKNKLETCLTNYSNNGAGQYVLGLYMKNGDDITYLNIEDQYVPDFVKEYFK